MSTACMSKACSISARMALVQGSAPKMPALSEVLRGIDALTAEFVQHRQHVGGRDGDDVGLEVGDELHLPFRHAARNRDHRHAEPLGAVVQPEPAREQAVAIGVVQLHAAPAARGADRARHHLGPHLDVALGVADHGRLARRAGGRMDAHDILARHGKQSERIVRAQVLLGRERELGEIRKRCSDRRDARRRHRTPSSSAGHCRRRAAASP